MRGRLADVALIAATYGVLAVAGGVVWRVVTPVPSYPMDKRGVLLDPVQVVKLVASDGWFAVIALVIGLVAGVLLAWRRTRDPMLTVLAITLFAGLAALLMREVGQLLSPDDLKAAIAHPRPGSHVSQPLRLHADAALLLLPAASLIGTLAVLWGLEANPAHTAALEPTPTPGDQGGVTPWSVGR